MKDLESLHNRSRDYLRDARKLVENFEQLQHDLANLREPADECSVLEQAKQIAIDWDDRAAASAIRVLLAKVNSNAVNVELSRPKREGVVH